MTERGGDDPATSSSVATPDRRPPMSPLAASPDAETTHRRPLELDAMYRGSRVAASFLLVVTGLAATAAAVFVVPPALANGSGRWLIPVALLFAVGHFAALVGVALRRDWGRNLAVFVTELGGGLAILAGVALLTGARPFGSSDAGAGLVAWTGTVYALLGIAAGRVPVLERLSPLERRRVVFGPSFAGIAP